MSSAFDAEACTVLSAVAVLSAGTVLCACLSLPVSVGVGV